MSTLPPVLSAHDCASWIKPAQVAVYARAAADLALLACGPGAGESFVEDGRPAADRADFAVFLHDAFGLMVKAHAHRAGIEGFRGAADELQRWQTGLREARS